MKQKLHSIRYKVLLFGLIMSSIPLVLISGYYLLVMSSQVEDTAAQSQKLRVESVASSISDHVNHIFERMEIVGNSVATLEDTGVYYDLLNQQESIDEIVLLNDTGDVLRRVSRFNLNDTNAEPWLDDQSLLNELKGDQIDHIFSGVKFNEYGQPYVHLLVPVSEDFANALGVKLHLQKLIGDVSSHYLDGDSVMYLRDQDERIIAHQDYSKLWQIDDGQLSSDNTGIITTAPIEELNWELAMEQPRSDMLSPVYGMLTRGGLVAAAMILFGSVISIYAGLYFVKPIEKLQSGMRYVKTGYWPDEMPVERRDEFGELTRAFNEMNKEIQQKERSLEQEKERLSIVVNSMEAGLAVIRKDYSIAWMNPTLKGWIGERSEVPCFQMFSDHNDSPCYSCPLSETTFEKMDETLTKTDENGEQRIYRHRVFPLQHTLEEGEEALVVMEDITEEKRLEEKLIQTDKLSALGRMASSFAHEVNNPLASVQVYAEDLTDRLEEDREELLDSGDMDHYLHVIRKNIHRCKEITANLLNFSRQSSWKITTFSVEDVMNESLMLMEHNLKKHGIKVTVKVGDHLPPLDGDPLKTSQVFVNLLQNAIDAMSDQADPQMMIFMEKVTEGVAISVKDNGSGIPEEYIPKLFDPFFTSKPTGQGTGLGLSVCYGIVEQMNGTLEVDSEQGKGTTFKVVLPKSRSIND
ncbi:ATP-binding protein [Texcoconibacillus texcoconensis]|uniref:histidine kinase n=1 Tax=Texcoconibacillus texcoconensis TaxID=1095777 RepID=A0A840QC82_9BACI|nr:ATP-binding protein [Texcoconibacillus texcoconensis]MBB5171930.1 C4-dicarboxylate-specific signal transduction histidine kinase [Texcoconibacillus texcoconensis]